ncbi:hypothetical protein CRG98_029280 [Punica granatum]|uniref:Uncharacterized protein n=1 Tax=Punica granatum TaxID=22663 RepID=A0A2I0J3M4_PUNGR|nr:hypothetical protein CRG98_029280 [Punica granatum]
MGTPSIDVDNWVKPLRSSLGMASVRTRISSRRGTHARAYATRLRSVHLPGDARQMHVRRSRHLPFYDPKVEGRQVTQIKSIFN